MRFIRLFKRDLAIEISKWVNKEIISIKQAESICHLYGMDYHNIQRYSYAYQILLILAYLFIGIALIIVIGENWEGMPREVRMGGLLLITVGVQSLALRYYLANKTLKSINLFLLGNICYGTSIILIAQIYHLGEHMPDGVFWWALGSVPFAILTCNGFLMSFGGILALIWLCMEFSQGLFAVAFPLFFTC